MVKTQKKKILFRCVKVSELIMFNDLKDERKKRETNEEGKTYPTATFAPNT
jgi:hypothetical protein